MAEERHEPNNVETRLRRVSGLVALTFVLAVGALTTSSSPLYADVYPPEGSNRLTPEQFAKSAERAFVSAVVKTQNDPNPVVQLEPATVTASLIIGSSRASSADPRVKVAFDNEATLRALDKAAVEVEPSDPVQRGMDECQRLPEGGCALTWTWTILAKRQGTQKLLLKVSPLIYINGKVSPKFKERNRAIPVKVEVHPVVKAIQVAKKQSKSDLRLNVPKGWSAGRSQTVSATLVQRWPQTDAVHARIELIALPGSPKTSIREKEPVANSGSVTQGWEVEPQAEGLLTLGFTAYVEGQAGDEPQIAKIAGKEDVQVAATIWARINAPVAWLGGIIAFAAGVVGLVLGVRQLRSPKP